MKLWDAFSLLILVLIRKITDADVNSKDNFHIHTIPNISLLATILILLIHHFHICAFLLPRLMHDNYSYLPIPLCHQ